MFETHQEHIFRHPDLIQFQDRFNGVRGIVETDDNRFRQILFPDPMMDDLNKGTDIGVSDKAEIRTPDLQSFHAQGILESRITVQIVARQDKSNPAVPA